ncbi:unnamed protein product, partial [Hydatigera taeniaeformis]|uniref:HSA domain-containing protein n=1 Tax=Hydatigena taeniaeformis TaxID=6205 RepID=A0A0R3WUU9_HYDTA
MVHKRRPSKGSQTISQPQTQILPMDCDENVLQSVTHNIDAIHQDLSLLDLESFLLPSTHLPVLDVDAAQLKNVQQSHLLPLFNNVRTASRSSKLYLPRSIAPQSTIPSVQHYVLIPNAALNRSNHLAPCSSVLNIPERSDGRYTIAMEAKREATVIKKVNKLIKRGLWSSNRLPKVMEPPQPLCHWDHLLEEACWLAEDFKQERLWKKAIAKKLADAAMMFCMISSELARRNEEELEGLRQRGAAMVAKMVQDWWAEVSETASSLSALSEHRQWCAALQRNRVFLTHLTDTGANWMFEAVSRSSRSMAPPPFSASKQTLPLAPTMVLEEEDVDELWLPPKSSTSSTANGSVESLTDAGVQFNPDAFSWGLQSHMITAAPMSLDSSPSEGDSEDHVSTSSDSSGASTLATDQEDV